MPKADLDLLMQRPFLSVVVPTYNRATELDRQLGWLHRELTALDVTWELRVHDNASTDETPEVCARWAEVFGADVFTTVRNPTNTGGVPNLDTAIAAATGLWTWSVGDDDIVYDGAAAHVVDLLQRQPDLTLLYLNYRGVDGETGETLTEHYFDPSVSGRLEDGAAAFAFHVEASLGSVVFLTCTVFRTDLVHAAQRRWRAATANWGLVAYWTGFVSALGPVYITPENWIDCMVGVSHWQSEDGAWTKAIYHEIPLTFVKLHQEGYSARMCRDVGFAPLAETVTWRDLRAHLRALKVRPASVATLARLGLTRATGPR